MYPYSPVKRKAQFTRTFGVQQRWTEEESLQPGELTGNGVLKNNT